MDTKHQTSLKKEIGFKSLSQKTEIPEETKRDFIQG